MDTMDCFSWRKSRTHEEVYRCVQPTKEKNALTNSENVSIAAHKEEEDFDYNMEHKKRGICLIFNQFEFYDKKRCPTRYGTDRDCSKLETRFGSLGFKVIPHKDLTYEEIFKVIKDVSSQDHSDEDCFVCCVLTHGYESGYIFAKDREYNAFLLLQFFTPKNCPTLEGKPKIFIFQACRGTKLDDGFDLTVTDSPSSKMSTSLIPPNPDFLVVFSSMVDHYSFRDTQTGTWLIQSLTKFMLQYMNEDIDFLSLLTIVNRFIAFECMSKNTGRKEYNDKKQIVNISHTLTKRIFFKVVNNLQ